MNFASLLGRGELAARPRLAWLALGFLIYVLAGPGMLTQGGSPLGALGLVFWALTASRPGPKKARIEFLCGMAAFSAQTTWMALVFWAAMPAVSIGWGLWAMYPGMLIKRLGRCMPLSLATPIAWIGFESLLTWTKTPIGLSWLRLGHYMSDWPALAGSARVWGDLGLGFVLAACAGWLADALRARFAAQRLSRMSTLGAVVPLLLAAAFALIWRTPEMQPGPRLLLVQPAFEQKRKQITGRPEELLAESFELTRQGLEQNRAAGRREPDLVVWGESMLFTSLVEDGLEDVIGELEIAPWNYWHGLEERELQRMVRRVRSSERSVIAELMGGRLRSERLLPERSSFMAGIDGIVAHEGHLRLTVGAALWSPTGERLAVGSKVHLAPGGETMVGLEEFQFVRDVIYDLANYVPDRLAAEESSSFEISGREGESWTLGASICFDNAYADPYAGPLRRGPVDFHMVVSNEAWYERTQELDQMMAFSRILALSTGRSMARVANSGISALIGPDGRELERLRVGGDDRMVRGTLFVDVPVPTAAASATRTPFVHLQPWLLPLGSLLPLLVLLFAARRAVTAGGSGSSGGRPEGDVEQA